LDPIYEPIDINSKANGRPLITIARVGPASTSVMFENGGVNLDLDQATQLIFALIDKTGQIIKEQNNAKP
jgi:hypothetical protein